MSKRTVHTTITPLPAGLSRETVMATLRNHLEMIDLNPLVIDRYTIPSPAHSTAEETSATWYEITDRITYVPGLASSNVTYTGCFHDLPDGLQTHVHAPMGLDIRSRWLLGGTLPGEPPQPVELGLGIPRHGLWLREDVDMKCNLLLASFVKKTLRKAHSTLVGRMLDKVQRREDDSSSAASEHQQHPFQISMATSMSAGTSLAADSTSRLSDGYADSGNFSLAPSVVSQQSGRQYQPQYQKPLPATPANPASQRNAGQTVAERYSLEATNNLDHYPRPTSNQGRANPSYSQLSSGSRTSQPYPMNHGGTYPSQTQSRAMELPAQRGYKGPLELPG